MSYTDAKEKPWHAAGLAKRDEVQLERWKAALTATAGNISRAALKLGISSATATRLIKKFELGEFAAELRVASGRPRTATGERKGVVTGCPRGPRKG